MRLCTGCYRLRAQVEEVLSVGSVYIAAEPCSLILVCALSGLPHIPANMATKSALNYLQSLG